MNRHGITRTLQGNKYITRCDPLYDTIAIKYCAHVVNNWTDNEYFNYIELYRASIAYGVCVSSELIIVIGWMYSIAIMIANSSSYQFRNIAIQCIDDGDIDQVWTLYLFCIVSSPGWYVIDVQSENLCVQLPKKYL